MLCSVDMSKDSAAVDVRAHRAGCSRVRTAYGDSQPGPQPNYALIIRTPTSVAAAACRWFLLRAARYDSQHRESLRPIQSRLTSCLTAFGASCHDGGLAS